MKQKQFVYLMVGVVALLMLPLIGSYISAEINWSLFDYIVMGILLTVTGLTAILVYNRFKNSKLKFLYLAIIGVVFLLIYIELAVGLFGSPIAGD
ncbi:hypothetical protein FJ651_14620 [Paucihalobacter ruber]|uniref:Uncharacterized protein n=1 Tax=Paucihalobacter ruber TaxID=2567861 RepID=A0A506PD18_9FLAO|nr:hypothetical protein [Paucihalobacter ruber]TPV31424.1 hypothetical protein FJ651_14620 [Paucihalobacter ruber]